LGTAVAALLGVEAGAVPGEDPALADWLAQRGFVRVGVSDPAGFRMAGAFLGRYERGWAVLFGVPPGPIMDPEGVATDGGPPLEVSVLAPLELPSPSTWARPDAPGRVESVAIAAAAEAPMQAVQEARAIPGHGLEGDRYAAGAGTFSTGGSGRDLTLIESEAVADLDASGISLEPVEARRNLVVSGIRLDGLIGRRFRIGEIECSGARRCEPCAHLQRLTQPGVLRGLVHRGGLRADVLSAGQIRVGDEIVALD
jgi:MOSC domain-containing protein YiiM